MKHISLAAVLAAIQLCETALQLIPDVPTDSSVLLKLLDHWRAMCLSNFGAD